MGTQVHIYASDNVRQLHKPERYSIAHTTVPADHSADTTARTSQGLSYTMKALYANVAPLYA